MKNTLIRHKRFLVTASRLSVVMLVMAFSNSVYAQWVKEDDTTKIWLKDGIYLNEKEMLNDSPNLTWANVDLMNWRTRDSLERKRILVYPIYQPHVKNNLRINDLWVYGLRGDTFAVITLDSVWGICIHGEPFRHLQRARGENFIRIPVSGTISYFQYTVYYDDPFYWTPDVMRMEPEFHTERIDLVVDFEKKDIYKNTRSNLEQVLQRDSLLWNKYQLEKRKLRVLDEYLKQYNKRNPLTEILKKQ